MHTDKQLYRLFQTEPAWLFELTRLPSPGPSVFRSVAVKALARTADGVIEPQEPTQPLTVVEFQFEADDTIYARLAGTMAALQIEHGMRPVQGLIIFRYPALDPQTEPWTRSVQPLQLRELVDNLEAEQPNHPLVAVFRPVLLTNPETLEREAVQYYRQIRQSELPEPLKQTLVEVFLSWLEQRLPHLGREELQAMFVGELTPLEETKLGKELIGIGEARGRLEMLRANLLDLLRQRFSTVSDEVCQRIANADLPALQGCLAQVLAVRKPEDLRW